MSINCKLRDFSFRKIEGELLHPSLSMKKKWTGKDIIFKVYNRKYANRELILHTNFFLASHKRIKHPCFHFRETLYPVYI